MAERPTCVCIVSRDRVRGSDFIAALGASLRPLEQLEIVVDRRSGGPSNWDPTEERRQRPQIDLALKANGFAIVPAPKVGGPRPVSSLRQPSVDRSDAGDSDSGYADSPFADADADYPDVADDDERLESIRSFKAERASNPVPWLVAALAVVGAAAFILSPVGHALKQTMAQRMAPGTTSSTNAAPPARADRSAAAETPPSTVPVEQVPSAFSSDTSTRDPRAVESSREAVAPAEGTAAPKALAQPGAERRARSTDIPRSSVAAPEAHRPGAGSPAASTSRPAQPAVASVPDAASRSVSPRFAGLPRVELSREPGAAGGTYSASILDPAGKPLPDAEVLLLAHMADGTVANVRMDFYPDRGTYRGSLPTASTPVDLRMRVITGDKRVEIPLGP